MIRLPAAALLVLLALPVAAPCHAADRAADQTFDLILRNGTILDGTGTAAYRADLAVHAGRIARIGKLAGAKAAKEIDATGLYVAPGFINIHDHPTPDGLRHAENMLTQGVTTELLNPDGGAASIGGTDPTQIDRQLSQLAAPGIATNIGAYIGFNGVWESVMGKADKRATEADTARMQQIILRNLQAGAFGVSAGLDYKPGYYARTEEVIAVVGVAKDWRTNFPNHERLIPETDFSSRAGIAETIAIGEAAGLSPVITHIKAQGREQGKAAEIVGAMEAASARGSYTPADVYPYLAGQTGLGALTLPAWAVDGGREAFLQRAADPDQRRKMAAEAETAIRARFGKADSIRISTTRELLVSIMQRENIGAGEAIIRTLEKADTSAVIFFGAESDLVRFLQYPATAVACDCGARSETASHPRYWGTFPRVLGRYVREQKVIGWEQAVSQMSGVPATTIGLTDRGLLGVGMIADVTVFDPRTVIDRATFEQPNLPSEGIRYVLVNGAEALHDGKATKVQAGKILLRTEHMPTRRLVAGDRAAAASFDAKGGGKVRFEVAQKEGARRASGSFRLTGAGRNSLTIDELGILQVTKGWASFSGRARFADGREELVTVIADDADPLAKGAGTIVIDGNTIHLQLTAPAGRMEIQSAI